MHLNEEDFLTVIRSTPLVSIDLVLRSPEGRILLGKRINEPAKGYWFAPGGRIYKGESIEAAFHRICQAELGSKIPFSQAKLYGAFTHIYDTNGLNAPGVQTHYVVLAYEILVDAEWMPETMTQHNEWKWCARAEADETVHPNNFLYYQMRITDQQYQILNARRDSYNSLIWQTPAINLVAQAFLFTIILASDADVRLKAFAAIFAALCSFATLQLLSKHRLHEIEIVKMLDKYEIRGNNLYPINKKISLKKGLSKLSSFRVWIILNICFGLGALLCFICLWWDSISNIFSLLNLK